MAKVKQKVPIYKVGQKVTHPITGEKVEILGFVSQGDTLAWCWPVGKERVGTNRKVIPCELKTIYK